MGLGAGQGRVTMGQGLRRYPGVSSVVSRGGLSPSVRLGFFAGQVAATSCLRLRRLESVRSAR